MRERLFCTRREHLKIMKPKNKDEIREKLANVVDFLNMQSIIPGEDTLSWAADCIKSYLEGKEKSLDHAFGLRSSNKGQKQMKPSKHDNWVADALKLVLTKTPEGKPWPDIKELAKIGRFCGLGGGNQEDAEDPRHSF
jgi:hypothetical protein